MGARDDIVRLQAEIALLEPVAVAEDALKAAKQSGDTAGIKEAKKVLLDARNAYRSFEGEPSTTIRGAGVPGPNSSPGMGGVGPAGQVVGPDIDTTEN